MMLASMSFKLQTQHENIDAQIIIMHLKKLFYAIRYIKRYETSKKLFRCKMTESSLVNTCVLKMIGYFKKLG
jgi:hypothetical protein